jgi:hypothetical protein
MTVVLIEMNHERRPQKQRIINKALQRMSFLLCRPTTANWCDIDRVTIEILPGDVLLEIFYHYVAEADKDGKYERWQRLVHVCQKWRYVVFRSPLRLNLQIICSARTPVMKKLSVWPALPIIIQKDSLTTSSRGEDNFIAALEHVDPSRVCAVHLAITNDRVLMAMQKTYVALKEMEIVAYEKAVIPDSFLGGSAPHLRHLWLAHVQFPFPVLRKLLLSTPNLVILSLRHIPHSGYLSPEAMVTCLSALTRLKYLSIGFESPRSRPPREGRHPPPTRFVLPALTEFTFFGVSEYLENLVTWIDAPLLNHMRITFFHQLIFDTPQLAQFISRTPKLNAYDEARVIFSDSRATIALPGRDNLGLQLEILCKPSDWQLSSLEQVCTLSFPQALILKVEHLYMLILEDIMDISLRPPQQGEDDLENNQWLEFFHPFTTVKNLYLSREFVPRIAPILQELVGERVTKVLPSLQSIFLEDSQDSELVTIPEAMRQFITVRQLSSHPIAISPWTRKDHWKIIY